MTPRSIRRAAERKTLKESRKALNQSLKSEVHAASSDCPSEVNPAEDPTPTAPSRAEINRANSQHSTGPKTPEGKATSSLNAVKTALTGRTVLLPADDAEAYRSHVLGYFHELLPVGPTEIALVQSLADTAWRLERIPVLEMNIYALGHTEFASQFESYDPAQRPGLIEVRTFLTYERQLRNLQTQEARLCRHREKDTAQLHQLQQIRKAKERQAIKAAANMYLAARAQGKPFHPAEHGFEFSTAEIEDFIQFVQAAEASHNHEFHPDSETMEAAA